MITGRETRRGRDHLRRHGEAELCRPVARRAGCEQDVWRKSRRGRTDRSGGRDDEQPRLCRAFNFKGGDQQKRSASCRAASATASPRQAALKSGGNVLLLDEPTNDLDVETLRAGSRAEDFAGCAVIISHDRFFLTGFCTHILAFEGDAHVEWFEGNFEDYEADQVRRLGP